MRKWIKFINLIRNPINIFRESIDYRELDMHEYTKRELSYQNSFLRISLDTEMWKGEGVVSKRLPLIDLMNVWSYKLNSDSCKYIFLKHRIINHLQLIPVQLELFLKDLLKIESNKIFPCKQQCYILTEKFKYVWRWKTYLLRRMHIGSKSLPHIPHFSKTWWLTVSNVSSELFLMFGIDKILGR